MSDENRNEALVLIPFGDGLLELTREQFDDARRRGLERSRSETNAPPAKLTEILDAKRMEGRTGIAASWWLAQARQKMIPHIGAGKYVRFDLAKVLKYLTIEPRHADSQSSVRRKVHD